MCGRHGAPPASLTVEEALRSVQADISYEADPASLAPLRVDLLSLPPEGSVPVPLRRLLGRAGDRRVEDFIASKVVAKEVFMERKAFQTFVVPTGTQL